MSFPRLSPLSFFSPCAGHILSLTTLSAPNCAHQFLLYCGFKKGSASGPFLPALKNPPPKQSKPPPPPQTSQPCCFGGDKMFMAALYLCVHTWAFSYRLFAMHKISTHDWRFFPHKQMPQTSSFPSNFIKPNIWPSVWRRHSAGGGKVRGKETRSREQLSPQVPATFGDSGQTQPSLTLSPLLDKVEKEFSLNPPCSPIVGEIGTQNCLEVYKV